MRKHRTTIFCMNNSSSDWLFVPAWLNPIVIPTNQSQARLVLFNQSQVASCHSSMHTTGALKYLPVQLDLSVFKDCHLEGNPYHTPQQQRKVPCQYLDKFFVISSLTFLSRRINGGLLWIFDSSFVSFVSLTLCLSHSPEEDEASLPRSNHPHGCRVGHRPGKRAKQVVHCRCGKLFEEDSIK